jgi:hypothetical protein
LVVLGAVFGAVRVLGGAKQTSKGFEGAGSLLRKAFL